MVGKKSLFIPYDINTEGNHDFHNEIGQFALSVPHLNLMAWCKEAKKHIIYNFWLVIWFLEKKANS